MQKIRICYKETATGEHYKNDVEVETVTLDSVMQALNATLVDSESFVTEPWIGNAWVEGAPGTFAFIATCKDASYFGTYLITGAVYTEFYRIGNKE